MFLHEPDWRRRRGRTHDDFQALLRGEFNHAVQPGKVKLSLFRFHECPGEFTDVYELETEALDVVDVAFPLFGRPCFRVVVDADGQHLRGREVAFAIGVCLSSDISREESEPEQYAQQSGTELIWPLH